MPLLTVILCTHNPHSGRLARTLAGLTAQTLPVSDWELLVIDNASTSPLSANKVFRAHANARIVAEIHVGLTRARLRGIAEAQGELLVFVDDDNVLSPAYLANVVAAFARHPRLVAAGGPVRPVWETPPPAWAAPFHGLLALRDLGPAEKFATGAPDAPWPDFAPVGAGLAIRRDAARAYAAAIAGDRRRRRLDRAGSNLASGGDNDLVFTALHAGGDVAYLPELSLTHLIPAARLKAAYLASLNRGIMRTWVQVLALHGQCPWPAISPWTVPLRVLRAWLRAFPWLSRAARVRFAARLGQFEGQADLTRFGDSAK